MGYSCCNVVIRLVEIELIHLWARSVANLQHFIKFLTRIDYENRQIFKFKKVLIAL